jgi:hypothetical protein
VRYDLDFDFALCTIRSSDNSVWISDNTSVDPQVGTNAITLNSFLHEKFGSKDSSKHNSTVNNQSKSALDFSRIDDSNQFAFGSNDQFVSQLLQQWRNSASVEELSTICKQVLAYLDRQKDKSATSAVKHTASVSNPTGAVASPTASSSNISSASAWSSDLIQAWLPFVLQSIAQQVLNIVFRNFCFISVFNYDGSGLVSHAGNCASSICRRASNSPIVPSLFFSNRHSFGHSRRRPTNHRCIL